MSICRAFGVFLCLVTLVRAADDTVVRDALAALRRGDFAVAEQKLRVALQAHPNDGPLLSLLGVALDGQHKAKQAEAVHRRALANAPNSPDALNNYANHLLGVGDEEAARKTYLKLAAADPSHRNANVQLARLAIKRRSGVEALGYLKHLPDSEADHSTLAPLRLAALYLAGRKSEADALSTHLLAAGKIDLGVSLSTGMALADAGQFDRAEGFLNQALALAPSDFTVLSNLAVVASHNGDHPRARELLESALRQQPQNVEVLYLLAYEDQALRQNEAAVGLLARAAKLAPERADVQKLLALATSDLGALEDASAAWDRYRKLVPGDDAARRERGFIAVQMGQFERGLADLRWFATRHPDDAVGHYELGTAESRDDPAQGLVEMDKALSLKPDFVPALAVRGGLYYQMGRPETALTDLETVARLQPDDAVNLDRLGQTYLALDRPADAVKVLRKAAGLAPDDSKTQLHFARALADAGQAEESRVVMDRFRQLGPVVHKAVPGGLVDYLSLTPEQRQADYRTRVEKLVREHPDDAAAQVSYVKLLLDEGKPDQASAAARRAAALKPSAALLADAGRALLEAKQYAPAKQLLELAAAGRGDGVVLDLAIAAFHAAGAGESLQQLDRVPEAERTGDYYLARAQMLEASGRSEDASSALEAALRSVPRRVDLYRQTVAFLLEKGNGPDALRLLDHAVQVLPRDREILLIRATVLDLAGQVADAEHLLNTLQDRWPEWPAVWAAHGLALATHGHFDDARRTLETAVALGAHSPDVRSCLAESALRGVPPRFDIADSVIRQALAAAPNDPRVQSLAARIARRDASSAGEDPNYLRRLLQERPSRDW